MFDSPASLRSLHLEITEKCNAACPLCLRTDPNGLKTQPFIGTRELSRDDLARFFQPGVRKNLEEVHLCGSYGDPIMASECGEIVDLFSTGSCAVSLSTNGGARGVRWWTALGEMLARNPDSRVDFHIDGLSGTSSFYRRNTSFKKVITNAKAFIDAGGRANWEFIPFKHNEHQVEEARALSQELGFDQFTIKKSNWGVFNNEEARISFTDRKGQVHFLEPPAEQYRPKSSLENPAAGHAERAAQEISCKVLAKREIYVSCEGIVYPCCWTARYGRDIYRGRRTKDGFSRLFKEHQGLQFFDIRQTDLASMLKSEFFTELARLWTSKKPPVCYKKCGRNDQPEKVRLPHSKRF
jgi:MoaA/NifB/PqqE/SkfB family radical SAM enzyme